MRNMYIHVWLCICMYGIFLAVTMYTSVGAAHLHICTYIRISMHEHMYNLLHMYVRTYVRMYIRTYVYTHVCTYGHTYVGRCIL